MAYTKYSLTPADNNAAPPNGAPEGMLPSAVNDTMRDMMSQIRDVGDGIRGGTYTMTAPVITGGSISGLSSFASTGVATFSAGTVSAPSITTTGDTNTGIFFPAADTIAFTEGGVESMRIDSAGNINIGTSSFTASKVTTLGDYGVLRSANGTSASPITNRALSYVMGNNQVYANISFLNTLTSNNASWMTFNVTPAGSTTPFEAMRIDSAGNVGIGTNAPTNRLTLNVADGGGISLGDRATVGTFLIGRTGGGALTGNTTAIGFVSTGSTAGSITYQAFDGNHIFYAGASPIAERMRIDSAGNVGIGTTSPAELLSLSSATNATLSITRPGTDAVEIGVAAAGPYIQGGANLQFITGASPAERMRITSDGYLRMASGSGGIQFNGDTAAANALDDYEEGTFTPTMSGSVTAGTGTYSNRVGRYTKVGNRVHFAIYLSLTAHTGTGNILLTGLPFTINDPSYPAVSVYTNGLAMSASSYPQGYADSGSTAILLRQTVVGGSSALAIPIDAVITNFMVSGQYIV